MVLRVEPQGEGFLAQMTLFEGCDIVGVGPTILWSLASFRVCALAVAARIDRVYPTRAASLRACAREVQKLNEKDVRGYEDSGVLFQWGP